MKTGKRILALLLVLSLVLTVLVMPIHANAGEEGSAVMTENVLLSDDFSGDLSQWNTELAAITDGKLQLGTVGGGTVNAQATPIAGTDWTNYTLEFDADFGGNPYRGISFRRQDNGDDYFWWFGDGNTNIKVVKRVSGAWTEISDVKPSVALSGMHHFKLEVNGAEIKTYVDDVLYNTGSDEAFTTGGILLFVNYDAAWIDNVTVTAIAEEGGDEGGEDDTTEPAGTLLTDDFSGDLSQWNSSLAAITDDDRLQLGTVGGGMVNALATPVVGSDWTNYTLEFDADFGGNPYRGISFRRQDNGDDYFWWFGDGNTNIKVVKRVGGVWTDISDIKPAEALTGTHHFKLEVNGSEIKTYVDDVLYNTGSDGSFATGGILFFVNYDAAWIDNVTVTAIAEEGGEDEQPIPEADTFYDDFSDGLSQWTSQTAVISDGTLQLGTVGGSNVNAWASPVIGSSWTNYTVEFDADFGGNPYRGVSFRRQDNGDDYFWWFGDGNTNIKVVKRVGGVWTDISDIKAGNSLSGTHRYKLEINGPVIKTYVDGVLHNTGYDEAFTTGGILLQVSYGVAWFDNVSVAPIAQTEEEFVVPEDAIFYDDYSGDLSKWNSQTAAITDGRLQLGTEGGGAADAWATPIVGSDWTDYVLEFDADFGGSPYRGISFRRQDNGDDYFWWFGDGSTNIKLVKRVGGAWTDISDVKPTVNLFGPHHFKLVVQGSRFSAYVDDVLFATGSDEAFASGGILLFVGSGAAWFDNVVVRPVNSEDVSTGTQTWDTDGDGVLEIMAIGNSFSEDAMQYVWQIANDLGVENIVLGNVLIGGCTLEMHADNAAGDLAEYIYYYNDNGSWNIERDVKMSTVLASRSWDYISLQQSSGNSGLESTYNEDLTYLITYLQERSSAKLVWHMTWAYQQNCSQAAFANYGNDQMTMYNAIVSAVQNNICTNEAFELIVPSGTAVQNARTSLVGDTLTRDGYHMSLDLGRYLTGLMFVKTLTGLDISEISYAPGGVSDQYRTIAVESVNNAAAQPFAVTQSAYTGGSGEDNTPEPEIPDFTDDFSADLTQWVSQTAVITDGRLQLGTVGGGNGDAWATPTVGSGWTDYVLEFDADFNGHPYRGISFRRQANGDDYFLWFGDGATNIKMVKRVGGAWTDISNAQPGTGMTGTHHFKLVVQGSEFRAYVDGTLFVTGSDEAFKTGGVLLFVGYDAAWFDNVVVREVTEDDVNTGAGEESDVPEFSDNFSGDLSGWIKDKASISGGRLQLGTVGGGTANAYAAPSVGSSWTDYVIEFDADFNGESYRGVSFRRQDNGDDYLWWFGDANSNIQIVKRVGGSWEPIGNVQPAKTFTGTHHFKVVVKGSTFTTFVDGEIYNIASDADLAKGGFLFLVTYDAAWFDNVVVRPYQAGDEYGAMANKDLWPEARIDETFVVEPEKWDGQMYEVSQGRLQLGKTGGGNLEAYYGPQGGYGWTDYVVEFDADFDSQYYRGISFRRQQTGGDYLWWFGDGGLGTLIMKRTATGWETVSDVQPAKALSGTHRLKLVVSGNKFLTFVDGVLCNTGSDDTYAKGGIQFFVNYGVAWIDNVVVRAVEPGDLETGIDTENAIPDLHEDFEDELTDWNVENGVQEDGKLRLGAVGGGELYAYAAPLVGKNWTDYVLTVDFNFGGQPYRGISFRRQENGDDYFLWFGDSNIGAQIVKRVNGGWEPISESYYDMKLGGGEHRIKLEVVGSEFKVSVDGAPILTANDEELTKGGILFFVNYEAAWIDNVSVTVPGEETTQVVPDSYDDDPFDVDGWQYEETPLEHVPVNGGGMRMGLIVVLAAAGVVLAAVVIILVVVAKKKKEKQ